MAWLQHRQMKIPGPRGPKDVFFRANPFVLLLIFVGLNHIIPNLKTVLPFWLLPVMPKQMVGAEQAGASAQGRLCTTSAEYTKQTWKQSSFFQMPFVCCYYLKWGSLANCQAQLQPLKDCITFTLHSLHLNFLLYKLPQRSLGGVKYTCAVCLGFLLASLSKA